MIEMRKRVEDSLTEQVHILRTSDMNGMGRLFGGLLMQWIDEVAVVVAKRHAGKDVTTAAVDNLNFKRGAKLNDLVVLVGRVTYVGTTSMEVRVDAYVEDFCGKRQNINRAHLVMVAMDAQGRPAKVPGLAVFTEAERARWEGGRRRYELRKERRREGY